MSGERPVEDLTFEEARTELEAIVTAIDDGAVDVDTLSGKVARAAALLVHCRQRISATRERVSELVTAVDDATAPPAADEPF